MIVKLALLCDDAAVKTVEIDEANIPGFADRLNGLNSERKPSHSIDLLYDLFWLLTGTDPPDDKKYALMIRPISIRSWQLVSGGQQIAVPRLAIPGGRG
jgi:hypothetical protein